jgi:hypothetical protein
VGQKRSRSPSSEELYAEFKKIVVDIRAEPLYQTDPVHYVTMLVQGRGNEELFLGAYDMALDYLARTVLRHQRATSDRTYLGNRKYSWEAMD